MFHVNIVCANIFTSIVTVLKKGVNDKYFGVNDKNLGT